MEGFINFPCMLNLSSSNESPMASCFPSTYECTYVFTTPPRAKLLHHKCYKPAYNLYTGLVGMIMCGSHPAHIDMNKLL